MCEALIYLLDNIYIIFGTKLYRQIVGIPIGTNCAPLVADLFLFCYERDFMTSLSGVKQAEIIEAFKSTSKYLDDLFKYWQSLFFTSQQTPFNVFVQFATNVIFKNKTYEKMRKVLVINRVYLSFSV